MLSVQLKRPARENDYRVAESYKALNGLAKRKKADGYE